MNEEQLRDAFQQKFDDIDQDIKEFNEWRDRYIRRSIYAGIIVLIAYIILIWWLL